MTQNSPTPGFKFGAAPSEPNALIKRPEVPSHTPVEGFKMAMRTPALGPVMNRTIGSNTAISKGMYNFTGVSSTLTHSSPQ